MVWRWVHSPYNEFKFTTFKEKTLDVYDLLAVKRRRLAGDKDHMTCDLFPAQTTTISEVVSSLMMPYIIKTYQKIYISQETTLSSDMVSWILPSTLQKMTTSFTPIPFFFPACTMCWQEIYKIFKISLLLCNEEYLKHSAIEVACLHHIL